MREALRIDPDIRRARTLPSWVYTDPEVFCVQRERVFVPSWQLAAHSGALTAPGHLHPFTLLEGCLDEPLVFTRDERDQLHCLSNVCTHRGNLVCEAAGKAQVLRCRYHGRRFDLAGGFLSMPEFEGVEGFPSPADDLPRVELGVWNDFLFVSLRPALALDELLAPVTARCEWMPFDKAVLDPSRSRDYSVRAHWALYCENYLEGFHIPYVHHDLAAAIDYGSYRTELFTWSNVQIGAARSGEDCFTLPRSSPDHGQKVAAYYFWLFPNTMFNIYPWGVSVNIVKPLEIERTRVTFLAYVWDPERLDRGAGAALDPVEREDEAVVEAVQRGIRSRLYTRGRYSPERELGVHQFHRLLAECLEPA